MIWIVRLALLLSAALFFFFYSEQNYKFLFVNFFLIVFCFFSSFLIKNDDLSQCILIDKSSLIDGRIYDLLKLKILQCKTILISQKTLKEIEQESKSSEITIMNRAKRASFIIKQIQKLPKIKIIITSKLSSISDETLHTVELSRTYNAKIITCNFKIYKDALISKAQIINIDFLEKALTHVYLPGETLNVFLVKEGSQPNQAVGFFNDGTMIVAEDGKKYVGKKVELTIGSVIQSSYSKMFFGKVKDVLPFQNNSKSSEKR